MMGSQQKIKVLRIKKDLNRQRLDINLNDVYMS